MCYEGRNNDQNDDGNKGRGRKRMNTENREGREKERGVKAWGRIEGNKRKEKASRDEDNQVKTNEKEK